MVRPYLVLLLVVAAERFVELGISRRNARWALAQGGREYGQAHFRWMQVLHTLFFFACAGEVVVLGRPFVPLLGYSMLVLAVAAQALRYWALSSLGHYWNVRVIVVPGGDVVAHGPYRYVRHPNYLAVIIEGIAIPLIHSAWITAVAFSLLNAVVLAVRIRCEEGALSNHCGYEERLGGRRRFMPRRAGHASSTQSCPTSGLGPGESTG